MNKILHCNNTEEFILKQGPQLLSPPWFRLLIRKAILFQFKFIGYSQMSRKPIYYDNLAWNWNTLDKRKL